MKDPHWPEGTRIWSRDIKAVGITTGSVKRCPLAGCTGLRLATRWKEGHLTWPCTKGLGEMGDRGDLKIG